MSTKGKTTDAAWPKGCHDPNSCARHGACQYTHCRHGGRDIGPAIAAALLASATPQEREMLKAPVSVSARVEELAIPAELLEKLEEAQALVPDGLTAAVVGITYCSNPRAVVCARLAVQCLQAQGMDYHEAQEFFDFNVAGAYVGDKGPIYIETPEPE